MLRCSTWRWSAHQATPRFYSVVFGRSVANSRTMASATVVKDTLFYCGWDNKHMWAAALEAAGIPLQLADEKDGTVPNPQDVRFAIAWNPPPGYLLQFPLLEAVQSPGAGVDSFFRDAKQLPPHAKLLRIVDPLMAERMAMWALWGVINAQRKFDAYAEAQRRRVWDRTVEPYGQTRDNANMRCGVMGMGVMGGAVASLLASCGYPVSCWVRQPRTKLTENKATASQQPDAVPEGVHVYVGKESLQEFVSQCDALICMLPLTSETKGIINAELLSWLPQGATVINGARGGHVDTRALLQALDSGHVGSCLLDVFETEPLPDSDPLWGHPGVRITPHVASVTNIQTAVAQIAQNRRQVLGLGGATGLVPGSLVDLTREY